MSYHSSISAWLKPRVNWGNKKIQKGNLSISFPFPHTIQRLFSSFLLGVHIRYNPATERSHGFDVFPKQDKMIKAQEWDLVIKHTVTFLYIYHFLQYLGITLYLLALLICQTCISLFCKRWNYFKAVMLKLQSYAKI